MAAAAAPIAQTSPSLADDSRRQSAASLSAASFLTAPQTIPTSRSSSRSSDTHTLTSPDPITTHHALAIGKPSTQEVHIVSITEGSVSLEPAAVAETALRKVGSRTHTTSDSADSTVGPPPPSPPSSIEHDFEDTVPDVVPEAVPAPILLPQKAEPPSRPVAPVTFDDAAQWSSTSRSFYRVPSSSSSQGVRSVQSTDVPRSVTSAHTAPDGHLQAPYAPHKPSRRNTTGSSTPLPSPPMRSMTIQGAHLPSSYAFDDADIEGALASDIQQQAEQIRRERLTKRAKAQQEAEKAKAQQEAERALTRTLSMRGVDRPLVGNLIGEDHVNYVLMYNMLTGIRIAVSRCQAKIRRPLTPEDYTARHKYSFDIVGNELTPSAKYDFKFKDYAPWVFRELREDVFQLDPADYLLSLTAKYILSELGSPGKSGSFFYFSRDYRFIIKTIHHNEHKFLHRILPQYHEHVKNNPHTLLSRFYGLHRVKLPHGRKIHFVIMNNLFPPHRDIHETYDLKGSTVGREYPEDKARENPAATLKDLNWINRGRVLDLGPEKRALLTEQLRRDSELLKKLYVMDYSLLVGIHNMRRGNRDNVRSNTLKVFSPNMPLIRRKPTQNKGATSPEAIALRRIMRQSDPKQLGSGTLDLPDRDTGERAQFIFYQDEGGLRATDEANHGMDQIYYLGVIDILTPYTTLKKLEHCWKGLSADRHKISPVPPLEYGDRFFAFMKAIMRGGEGGGRFKSE